MNQTPKTMAGKIRRMVVQYGTMVPSYNLNLHHSKTKSRKITEDEERSSKQEMSVCEISEFDSIST